MRRIIFQIMLIFTIISCNEKSDIYYEIPFVYQCEFLNDTAISEYGSVLTETQEIFYYEIWVQELLDINQITNDYFQDHYKHIKISSKTWEGGISFRVDYLYVFDWIKVKNYDEFMIYLNSSWDAYQHLDIPRNTLLNAEWVKYNISNNIWHDGICKINKTEKLLYKTCNDACHAFLDSTGYTSISPKEIAFYIPGKRPREDGNPYFRYYYLIDTLSYTCVKGYFNLFNGSFKVWEAYCGPIF